MATSKELSDFLASVERRAFRQTAYAVQDDHAALDIVQDAMMKLAEKYPHQPIEEYPMLFQRILQIQPVIIGVGRRYVTFGQRYFQRLVVRVMTERSVTR